MLMKKIYFSDNLPVVLLKTWPLEADLFDGDLLAGPVPSLYSEDPDSALMGLLGDPLKCHWDLSKISRTFFMPETITITEAVAAVKKPR